MYTLDAERQKWQILLIDEDDLLELTYRGEVADESLLYNHVTKNFTSAREHALLIGNARGLRMSRATTPLPSIPFAAANPLGKIPMMGKAFDLPSEPHNFRTPDALPPTAPPILSDSSGPVSSAWEKSLYSHTDEVVEGYIPTFRASVRLQIIGLLTLPLFGLGLPILLEGCRRKNHILRLVEQTGMDKPVWMNYVSNRVATFPFEQKALQMSAAFVSLIAVSAAVSGMSKASVRTEIGQLASTFSPAAPREQRAKHSRPLSGSQNNVFNIQRSTQ